MFRNLNSYIWFTGIVFHSNHSFSFLLKIRISSSPQHTMSHQQQLRFSTSSISSIDSGCSSASNDTPASTSGAVVSNGHSNHDNHVVIRPNKLNCGTLDQQTIRSSSSTSSITPHVTPTNGHNNNEWGVEDLTLLSDIDENGINLNLKTRYQKDKIYVSHHPSLSSFCSNLPLHQPSWWVYIVMRRESSSSSSCPSWSEFVCHTHIFINAQF